MANLIGLVQKNLEVKFDKVELQSSKNSHYFYINGYDFKFRISDHDAICGRSMTKHEVIARYMFDYGFNCTFERLGYEPFDIYFDLEDLKDQGFDLPNDANIEDLKENDGEFWTNDIKWLSEKIANYFENSFNSLVN